MTPTRLALLWTLVILTVCSVPGPNLPAEFLPLSVDKWVHATMFAVFAVLWSRARPGRPWQVLLAGAAFGVAIEAWQATALVGRTPDALDALADVVGLALRLAPWGRWGNDPAGGVSR